MYDTVWVTCPKCGEGIDFQSYAGDCLHRRFSLNDAPFEILLDLNKEVDECVCCRTQVKIGIRITGYIERV